MNSIIEEATNILAESSGRLRSDRGSLIGDEVAFGMRDTMLAKCKEAIETLYVDIAEERRRRKEAESLANDIQSADHRLEEKIKQQAGQITQLTADLSEAENTAQMLEQDNERLNEELKKLDKTQHLRQENEQMKENLESLQGKLQEKEGELESLAGSVSAVKKQLGQLENENEALRQDLEEMKSRNDDFQHRCERLQTQARISETVKTDLKRAQEDYARYLEEEKERSAKATAALQKRYEDLEVRLRDRFAQKDLQLKQELGQTIETIQRDFDVSSAEHLKTREECRSLKEENHRLKEYLSAKQEEFEKWKSAKVEQLERLQKSIEGKAQVVQSQEDVYRKERGETQKLIDTLKTENSHLLDELARAQEKWKKLELKLIEERRQYEALNKSAAEQQLLLDRVNSALAEREAEATALRKKESHQIEQLEAWQTRAAQEKQAILTAHEEHIQVLSVQHQRELEEEGSRLRLDLEREKVQRREGETRAEALEEELGRITAQRDQLANALTELDERVQALKQQHEEQAAKTKSSTVRANDQLLELSREARTEKDRRLQLEKVNKDLQQRLFELDAKLRQESALFRREAERLETEARRSRGSDDSRARYERLKDEVAEEVAYLKQWYESLRSADLPDKKWLGRFLDGLNSLIFRLETKSVKGTIETPLGLLDV
jgi:early endosome antigen 1